jgi:hypothetical protein
MSMQLVGGTWRRVWSAETVKDLPPPAPTRGPDGQYGYVAVPLGDVPLPTAQAARTGAAAAAQELGVAPPRVRFYRAAAPGEMALFTTATKSRGSYDPARANEVWINSGLSALDAFETSGHEVKHLHQWAQYRDGDRKTRPNPALDTADEREAAAYGQQLRRAAQTRPADVLREAAAATGMTIAEVCREFKLDWAQVQRLGSRAERNYWR